MGAGYIEMITEHSCEQNSVFINTMKDLRQMVKLDEQSSFKIWFFILIFIALSLVVSGIIQVLITEALNKVKKKKKSTSKKDDDDEASGEDSEEDDPKKKATGKKPQDPKSAASNKGKPDKKPEKVDPKSKSSGAAAKK